MRCLNRNKQTQWGRNILVEQLFVLWALPVMVESWIQLLYLTHPACAAVWFTGCCQFFRLMYLLSLTIVIQSNNTSVSHRFHILCGGSRVASAPTSLSFETNSKRQVNTGQSHTYANAAGPSSPKLNPTWSYAAELLSHRKFKSPPHLHRLEVNRRRRFTTDTFTFAFPKEWQTSSCIRERTAVPPACTCTTAGTDVWLDWYVDGAMQASLLQTELQTVL